MALPAYNKAGRRKTFAQLPKGAYVVKILSAKEDKWPSGDAYLKIAFDIAEGEYKGFYNKQYDSMRASSEDAKWPFDAVYNLNVPTDNSPDYVRVNYDTFFADLEDSNNGYVFDGDPKKLAGKLIGGKFANKQTEKDGNVYDHIVLKWTCVAEDVRTGNYGKMPNDKLISRASGNNRQQADADGFVNIPEGLEEELPF